MATKKEWARDLAQHLRDNDGEVVYWGETLSSPRHAPPSSRHVVGRTASSDSIMPVRTGHKFIMNQVRDPGGEPGPRTETFRGDDLESLRLQTIGDCQLCPLGKTRIKLVFGVGNPEADVMFVGEGPGFDEDRQGEPFVGKAGQLLDKIISAIGLDRTKVYISNVVKCHPMVDPATPEKRGNDRPPTPEEMETCSPFLREQIRIISPKVIVTLGATATKALLNRREGITALRGQFFDFQVSDDAPVIKLLPTFHPAALLRDENLKRPVWEDMKLLKNTLLGFRA